MIIAYQDDQSFYALLDYLCNVSKCCQKQRNQLLNTKNVNGDTPLHIATIVKRNDYAWELFSKGAKCNIPNNSGYAVNNIKPTPSREIKPNQMNKQMNKQTINQMNNFMSNNNHVVDNRVMT
jgi:ankyrin repeat protein